MLETRKYTDCTKKYTDYMSLHARNKEIHMLTRKYN